MEMCEPDNPMPDDADRDKWCHLEFETIYEGHWFDTVRCIACGIEFKISPNSSTESTDHDGQEPTG